MIILHLIHSNYHCHYPLILYSGHLVVSIPFWKISQYIGRTETSQSASSADETTSAGVRVCLLVQHPCGGVEEEALTSEESSQLQREECFTPDSEDLALTQMVTVNEDGASGDLEEPVITTLSACTNRELPVQAMIVPECSYLGAEDKGHLQTIERVMSPVWNPGPSTSKRSPLSGDASVSMKLPQPKHNNAGPKRWKGKGKKRASVLGGSESGVEGQSSKEQGQQFSSPQCISQLAQESIPDLPEPAAMDTASHLPLQLPCGANLLQRGGCLSPDVPQSTVERQPTTSSSKQPKAEPITDGPAEVRPNNGESSIQVKREAFRSDFKSTERYTFKVPMEYPNCARLVPIVYHHQKPIAEVLLQYQRAQEIRKEERRKLAREALCNQGSNGPNRALLPGERGSGLNKITIKQEPIVAGSCNSGGMVHPPQDMEPSSTCATASTTTEETSPATQPAHRCACLPPTPPEQVEELALGTKDLSVKELLSKFTMGNDEADEEEKEVSLPGEGDNSEVLTWPESGDRTDVSVGLEAGDGGKVASSSTVGLDLLTPSTLESLPTGMEVDSARTVSSNFLLSCQGDQIASESPLLAQQIQEMEDVGTPGDDGRAAYSQAGDRDPDMDGGRNIQLVEQKDVTATDKAEGSHSQLKQVKKKKLGRPRKIDKDQTALKLGRGKNIASMAVTSSRNTLRLNMNVSESPLSAQKTPKEMVDLPGDEESARHLATEGDGHIQLVVQKDGAATDVMEESFTELQQVKKKKVGRPRKINKEQKAPEPLHSGKGKHPAKKASGSSYNSNSLSHESVSESPIPSQGASKGGDNAPGGEVSVPPATKGEREPNREDVNIQPVLKDFTASNRTEGSCTELQPAKKKVGRPRKVDRSPPLSPVHVVREQDGIISSRKRARNISELASPAKRSRKSSPLSPEKEPPATASEDNRGTSPARVGVQSPKQPKRHLTRLLAAEGNKGACSSPEKPSCSQVPPETVNTTDSLNLAPLTDDKHVTAPVAVEEPPVQGKKRGRKIKLQSAKKVAQHLPSKKLLEGSSTESPHPAHEAVPVAEGAQDEPSFSADVQQGCNPTIDEPFTFNLEKNQERLSSSWKSQASNARDPTANTLQPHNSTPLSFSFILPESKAKVADATSRPDGTWVSNSESPPPLPLTPSSSISSYQPSPAGSSGDMAVDAEGRMIRKPEEGDLLELHPLGDFDDVSLLGEGDPRGPVGDLAGRPSKAMKCVLKTKPKMDRPVHLKMPPNTVSVSRGKVSPCLPDQKASQKDVNQRVRDWVEGISLEPPLPPPQQVWKTEPLRPEEEEEFVSASIVNGPTVMVNYSEFPTHPPSNQHGPPLAPEPRVWSTINDIPARNSFRRWKGFCRYGLLNEPCLHSPCTYHHQIRVKLPNEVKEHLAVSVTSGCGSVSMYVGICMYCPNECLVVTVWGCIVYYLPRCQGNGVIVWEGSVSFCDDYVSSTTYLHHLWPGGGIGIHEYDYSIDEYDYSVDEYDFALDLLCIAHTYIHTTLLPFSYSFPSLYCILHRWWKQSVSVSVCLSVYLWVCY